MIDKTMCEVLWRNISEFYVNLRVEVAAVSRNIYGVEKNGWYSYNFDKCNKNLCLSSRNMIDKAMCEVLWRNISDFYVNLRLGVPTGDVFLSWTRIMSALIGRPI